MKKHLHRLFTAALVLAMMVGLLGPAPVKASFNPPFTPLTGANNPFDGVTTSGETALTLGDLNSDGDLDLFAGSATGVIVFYQNTGTATAPVYVAATSTANPLDGVDAGSGSAPALGNLDGDADLDMVIGSADGRLLYYQNTGTPIVPAYTVVTGTANPFDGVDVTASSTPVLADLDKDGNLDLLVGAADGTIHYYRNDGAINAPLFVAATGTANPLDGVDVGVGSTPALADVDGDGDLDAFVGNSAGLIAYFRNDGSLTAPNLVPVTGAGNPFNDVNAGQKIWPFFASVDGDHDPDLLLGVENGSVLYYRNEHAVTEPHFIPYAGASNPFSGVNVGYYARPQTFVDLDGDGDQDGLIGEPDATLRYYRNDGAASSPVFTAATGTANPFNGFNVISSSYPALGDMDGDGDYDAVIGAWDGNLRYFRNDGTATAPVFVEGTGGSNPFAGHGTDGDAAPALGDLDGDGDLDLVLGSYYGYVKYYRNDGTATAPDLTLATGESDLFSALDVGWLAAPTLGDADGDGDLDLFVGTYDHNVYYYRNEGTRTAPLFVQATGTGSLFDGTFISIQAVPAFVNVDGDGDMDVIIGIWTGGLLYYVNNNAPRFEAPDGDLAVDEDAPTSTVALESFFQDPDHEPAGSLTYTFLSNSNPSLFSTTTVSGENLLLTYAANANGTATLVIQAADSGGLSVSGTLQVTVNPVNDAPAATDGALVLDEDASPMGTLTASDVEGDDLLFGGAGSPAHGTVEVNLDGSFAYTPAANYNGSDVMTFTVNDGHGGVDIGTVSITINPVNDAPVATDAVIEINEDTPLNGSFIAGDIDGDSLTFAGVSAPAHGALVARQNGTFTYIPAANYSGADSFNFRASDGHGGVDTATIHITVLSVNDAPAAQNDTYNLGPEATLTIAIPGVLANDSDVDNVTLTVSLVSAPARGELTLNADGSFIYTPPAHFSGVVTFTYRVSDGTAQSNIATVAITKYVYLPLILE